MAVSKLKLGPGRERAGPAPKLRTSQNSAGFHRSRDFRGELSVIREVTCTLYFICDYERIII